jgi:hypothetical protein
MRTRPGHGRHVRSSAPRADVPGSGPIDEIESDRRLERRLVAQCALSLLFVVVLVVIGRLLAP